MVIKKTEIAQNKKIFKKKCQNINLRHARSHVWCLLIVSVHNMRGAQQGWMIGRARNQGARRLVTLDLKLGFSYRGMKPLWKTGPLTRAGPSEE